MILFQPVGVQKVELAEGILFHGRNQPSFGLPSESHYHQSKGAASGEAPQREEILSLKRGVRSCSSDMNERRLACSGLWS